MSTFKDSINLDYLEERGSLQELEKQFTKVQGYGYKGSINNYISSLIQADAESANFTMRQLPNNCSHLVLDEMKEGVSFAQAVHLTLMDLARYKARLIKKLVVQADEIEKLKRQLADKS